MTYFPVLIPVGLIGNCLSFLVSFALVIFLWIVKTGFMNQRVNVVGIFYAEFTINKIEMLRC